MTSIRFFTLACAGFALLAPVAGAFDQTHMTLDRLLKQQVTDGSVNYAALKAAPAPLDDYLAQLAGVPEKEFDGWSEKTRLAFLVNLYNAATLRLIVDHYPVKSIRSIGWLPGSAWKKEGVSLFGRKISLDALEHGMIRKDYHDPRVHFALVCAARSCPPLRAEAYVGDRLDAQLDEQGRMFLGQTAKNRVEAATKTLYLSQIFKWFPEDFESVAGSVLKFVTPFFPEAERQALAAGDFKISYTDYDWSLNDRAKP
ncbi:MAG: DUF547 domain-containing protein [Opitutaceae bacterium]